LGLRIRLALQSGWIEKMSGDVGADETYIWGITRKMNAKQKRYPDQGAFRFNNRKDHDGERFLKAVGGISGRHLTYKTLIGNFVDT
jgi:hypothetical protein